MVEEGEDMQKGRVRASQLLCELASALQQLKVCKLQNSMFKSVETLQVKGLNLWPKLSSRI